MENTGNINTEIMRVPTVVFKSCIDKYSQSTEPIEKEWHEVQILVKPILSLKEMLEFVNGVVATCFMEDTNEYIPEVKIFAINSHLISSYTNIDLPEDTAERYSYVSRCDVFGIIMEVIDKNQFASMLDAIDAKLEQLATSNIQALEKALFELYGTVNSIEEQFEGMFSSLSGDDISKLITSMSENKFDETKLMDAYLESKNINNKND